VVLCPVLCDTACTCERPRLCRGATIRGELNNAGAPQRGVRAQGCAAASGLPRNARRIGTEQDARSQ